MSAGETTARRDLPSGTVTFLFTDVVGSTRLWEEHAAEMHDVLVRHDEIVRHAIESRGGYVVKTTGDGADAAFATAHDAIGAAVDAQRSLEHEAWHLAEPIRVRIGLHTGYAREREGDYYGPALNRAARLMSIADGRQIVISAAAEELARDALPEGVTLIDLGEHRFAISTTRNTCSRCCIRNSRVTSHRFAGWTAIRRTCRNSSRRSSAVSTRSTRSRRRSERYGSSR